MLTVENRFMIKEWYRKGLSVSEIARLSGCERKTIRKVLKGPVTPGSAPRHPRVGRIDGFKAYLQGRIQEGVLNARKLYGEIRARGYQGKESQVRAFVRPFREQRESGATLRFETVPGEQAQVDWGHFGLIMQQGRQRRLYAFVMTLGWSRAMYLEFTVSADMAWFLRCHLHAFHYFGGVPQEVLHDNLKTAVVGRDLDGSVHWNPRYLDFAHYYGFSLRACKPYRARTKGKVERGIKYGRGNFWPGLHFVDLGDLNRQAADWLNTVANVCMHGTTGEVPLVRLPAEGLQSMLAKPDYDTSLITYRRSSNDCLLSYEGNYCSVLADYARQRLLVKETEGGERSILNVQDEEIARHSLSQGHNQRVIQPAHYQALRSSSRPLKRPLAVQLPVSTPELAAALAAPLVEGRSLHVYEQLLQEER